MFKIIFIFAIFVVVPNYVSGHGMVLQPVNRASRWRVDPSAKIDYNDNQGFCGGFHNQWEINGGKCGLCGDNFSDPKPRSHELGGLYGEGIIVENYTAGEVIPVIVEVTANHLGFFVFTICNIDQHQEESEECFNSITLTQENGNEKFHIDDRVGFFNINLKLPEKLTCEHCVLRWSWTTGNSWGQCENGEYENGCGPQEMFKTCSDISISPIY